MDKITFTLAEIKKHEPCTDGWKKLCKSLGGIRKYGKHTPITIGQIIESNGLNDALWALRSTPEETHYLWRHFAVDCAEEVEHLMEDERSKNALRVARRHADGEATDEELNAAWSAAWSAARDAARAATRDAAWYAAWYAARAATRDATRDAAWAAAENAAWYAARTAWYAARAAARAAARGAARAYQAELLKEYCRTGERVIKEGE